MSAKMKNMPIRICAAILFWALCKNRKLMFSVARKIIANLTVKELLGMSFDLKDAIKNVT